MLGRAPRAGCAGPPRGSSAESTSWRSPITTRLPDLPRRARPRRESGIRLIDGAELSVSWRDVTLHVLGLAHRSDLRRARRWPGRHSRGSLDAGTPDRRFARRSGHPGRLRRRAPIHHQRETDQPHSFRAISGRSRPRARDPGRVQALPRPGQAGARAARMGGPSAGDRLDPRRRRTGRARSPGSLQGQHVGHARAARRIARLRRRRHRGPVAEPHGGADRVFARHARRLRSCSPRPAPTITARARAGSTWATCRRCPPASRPCGRPGERCRDRRRPSADASHRLLRFRPHRHHRRDARQQPAVAIRADRLQAPHDSLRRHAGAHHRGRGHRSTRPRLPRSSARWCSARSSTRR